MNETRFNYKFDGLSSIVILIIDQLNIFLEIITNIYLYDTEPY